MTKTGHLDQFILRKKNIVLECEFATYGDQCKETCGQCQDLTKCHHKNGTCLTGCKAGYHGVLCKTRKYMLVNGVLYWPIIYILEHIYLKIISSLDLVQCRYPFPLNICGMVWYGTFLLRRVRSILWHVGRHFYWCGML